MSFCLNFSRKLVTWQGVITNGANFSSTEQSFHWTDGSSHQYHKWSPGEPMFLQYTYDLGANTRTVESVGCVRMYTSEHDASYWDEDGCDNYHSFMCKVEQGITRPSLYNITWWSHQMEPFSALLALCEGNTPVTGGLPSEKPVTRSLDVFFAPRLIKRFSKQSRRRWFDTLLCSLLRQ